MTARALTLRQTAGFLATYARSPPDAFVATHRAVGPTFSVRIPGHRVLSTIDPEIIRHVLRERPDRFGKGRFGDVLAPLWGRSTVQISDGADWRRQRKVVAPLFHAGIMPAYGAAAKRRLGPALERLRADARAERPVPLYERLRDVHFQALCDVWFERLDDADRERIGTLLRRATDFAARRMLRLVGPPALVPTPANAAYKRLATAIAGELDALLDVRHAVASAPLPSLLRAACEGPSEPALSREEARNNLALFLLAAYEFPALGWTLQYIGGHPALKRRLLAEARAPEARDPPGPSLLECCAMETLRLVPPAPMLGRSVTETSEAAGVVMAAGTTVVVPVNALQRDPARWPAPDRFDPDRFREPFPQNAYLPFGAGPRGCIGQALARLLDGAVVAGFLAEFDFALVSARQAAPHDCLKSYPEGGVPVRLLPR